MSERDASTPSRSSILGCSSRMPSSREVGRASLAERQPRSKRGRTEPDDVDREPPGKSRSAGARRGHDRVSRGETISNTADAGSPAGASEARAPDSRAASTQGYSSAMAADAIFHAFPEPEEQQDVREVYKISETDRFILKQYPMLYLNLNAKEQPSVLDVQYDNEGTSCPLCDLDRNTLDSIKVLKPHQVKVYLESYNHGFTEEQVNIHLAHAVRDDDVIGVIQNMSVDLISKSYSLANVSSLRIMNRIRTHMGRPFLVPDQDVAKVHNDAVKQFIALASTCQALMKYKHSDNERGAADKPLL